MDWKRQGSKIRGEINNFSKIKNDLTQKVNIARKNPLSENEKTTITQIDNLLEKARNITESQIDAINEKIKYFNNDDDIDNSPSQEPNSDNPNQETLMNLMSNKEVLEQRRKDLENIHKTAAILKDTTDKMAADVNKQGAVLDEIETHVIVSNENAQKAKQEIIKADEISRGNRKKMICLLLIIFLAIGGITAILFSLVF